MFKGCINEDGGIGGNIGYISGVVTTLYGILLDK